MNLLHLINKPAVLAGSSAPIRIFEMICHWILEAVRTTLIFYGTIYIIYFSFRKTFLII